ncbi:MAG: nitroreductase family protein [Pseudomonas sp.]
MNRLKRNTKKILHLILPARLFNLIIARPRPAVISQPLYRKISRINKIALSADPNHRGDLGGIVRKESHIIDKGLQDLTREPGHSLDRAKKLKVNLANYKSLDDTFKWGAGILEMHEALQQRGLNSEIYSKFDFISESVGSEKILAKIIKERRSIRHFVEGSTPDIELIKKAIATSVWASSSCNRQTVVAFITNDLNLALKCAKQNKGATGVSGAFAFISVCYDTRSYFLPQESLTGLIDASLGFQNSLLMLHAMGLGACVLNWSHADKHEDSALRVLLRIPDYCEIAFNVAVGIPKFGAPIPARKSEDEYLQVIK